MEERRSLSIGDVTSVNLPGRLHRNVWSLGLTGTQTCHRKCGSGEMGTPEDKKRHDETSPNEEVTERYGPLVHE